MITRNYDLVSVNTEHRADTQCYYASFEPLLTTADEPTKIINATVLNHMMTLKKFWNILNTSFQVELSNHGVKFKKGRDYDEFLL